MSQNVLKTKEVVIDFRKNKSAIPTVDIQGHSMERVSEYKYLGNIFDDHLKFNTIEHKTCVPV